ncbi:hypothetical protein CBER1_11737 [Cercospora berteroae]|uniref:Zn(2)-C6 fungal-type domain-containing protein n=1 Tax=Cercospora berteroae TaxID=357750 RepID=A0A2S6C086_9PEZI|nr:hypothetical protein CBER1_11737 [Cercospora berteroae]
MPLRSTGCLKCRQRKIRCSEERPGCRKCLVHGVACPGYKVARKGDIEFHDQTDQTVTRLQADPDELRRPSKASPPASAPPEQLTFTWASFDAGTQPPNVRHTPPVTANPLPHIHPPSSLHSPAAIRVRLYDTFLRYYVPRDLSSHGHGVWSSNTNLLAHLMFSQQKCRPCLPHALDALALVQIGSMHHDRNLIQKAIEAYTKSLASLRVALSKPESVHDDTVMAATCMLSSCEFYTEFRVQGASWVSHQRGIQRMVDARGPASIMNSKLALHMFFQITSGSLALSLLLRKQDPYATEKWSAVEARATAHDDFSESNHLGLRLPALLERHDRLDLNHAGSSNDLDDLLLDCNEIQMQMRRRLMALHAREARDDKSWIALVEIEHFHPFSDLVTDRTMTRAFRFPSFETAYIHSSHWLRMYMLRQTIRSLHDMRQRLIPGWRPDEKHAVTERELLFYVLSFCRLVPFFVETGHGATGDMSCFFLLYIAEQYFRTNKHWRWVRWIKHVSERIFTKGMSMPFGIAAPELPSQANDVRYSDEKAELAFNRIEFPNAPLLPDVGRNVTPQGTVWMPSRSAPTPTSPALDRVKQQISSPG